MTGIPEPCTDPNVHARAGCEQCLRVIAGVRRLLGLPPQEENRP